MKRSLSIDVLARRGSFALELALEVSPDEIVAVIGPNGSGKSTLLDTIAGVLEPEAGVVTLGDRILSQVSPDSRRVQVARSARRVGYLGQRARLFPHMSLLDNVAYGLRSQGVSRDEARKVAAEWIDRVELTGHESKRPSALSGGQHQRGAIARTLAARPEALLLDEPFAALDVTTSDEIRRLIKTEAQRLELPVMLVTHDLIDAIVLAERIVVLDSGRVTQAGEVEELLLRPATPFAAHFVGKEFVSGTATARDTITVQDAPVPGLRGIGTGLVPGEPAAATFFAQDIAVTRETARVETQSLSTHHWTGTVASLAAAPAGVRIGIAEWPGIVAEMPAAEARQIHVGDRLSFSLAHNAVQLTPARLTPAHLAPAHLTSAH